MAGVSEKRLIVGIFKVKEIFLNITVSRTGRHGRLIYNLLYYKEILHCRIR